MIKRSWVWIPKLQILHCLFFTLIYCKIALILGKAKHDLQRDAPAGPSILKINRLVQRLNHFTFHRKRTLLSWSCNRSRWCCVGSCDKWISCQRRLFTCQTLKQPLGPSRTSSLNVKVTPESLCPFSHLSELIWSKVSYTPKLAG